MRRRALVLLSLVALAAGASTAARAHSTPQIRAAQAHARAVVAEINQIGRNLETVVQQYDGARLRLQQVELSLRKNEYRLHLARGNLHGAQRQLMSRIYSLYVNGQPTTLDVVAGANSLSQLIDRANSAQVLSNQDAELGREALRFERAVQLREQQLRRLKRQRAATVLELAAKRRTIQAALGQQKRLLASIHLTIHHLQVQEAARERRLRAAAEARLRAIAAAKAAAAAARARAVAAQQAQARVAAAAAPAPAPAPAAAPQAAPSSAGVAPPPVSAPPVQSTGAGHPQAASIALSYLGVPYVWGGASPSGFDCSGLVMYVYAQLGISLPHFTGAQWAATEPISQSQMEPGDLVFFDGVGHVGIYIGGGQMVDAPHTGSVVRIDNIAGFGSFDGARRVP